ncbi:MAG: glycosyl transferase [Clostridia bacterium]|nr:glycosyl transferase [Clostridia bacterium]
MIEKKIHYCWFGRGQKPKLAEKCIESWKKFCPDYEIIEWNEDNFDLDTNGYTRYCYDHKKWAYLSDYVRLCVIEEHGGIYFDTDVELIKKPDELLSYEAYYGFETRTDGTYESDNIVVNTGLGFGAVAHHPTVKAMKQEYEKLIPDESGAYKTVNCPALNTAALVMLGLKKDGSRQNVAGAEIFPVDFLNPYDDLTGRMFKTENTVSVHWFSKSAVSRSAKLRSKFTRPLHRIFGTDFFAKLRK